jgi:hypothetical protein
MTRTKLFSLLSIFALACLATPSSHAQICSTHSLRGSYGYTVTGSVVTPFGPLTAGPFAAVGRIVFDGFGHVTTVRSLSDSGNVLQGDAGTGTYSVNSDCTGSFNITVGPPGNVTTLTLNTVLDDNYELRGLVTNQGAVLVFEGRQQLPLIY